MHELLGALKDMAKQLDYWARESERGGYSTHQVEPMRKKAAELYAMVGRHADCKRPSYRFLGAFQSLDHGPVIISETTPPHVLLDVIEALSREMDKLCELNRRMP